MVKVKEHPRIIGDWAGTTWNDFLILPAAPDNDEKFTPDDVDISTDLAGVKLFKPFLTAAMTSVTGKGLAFAAGKHGMMGVVPRGLSIEEQVDIVDFVNKNAVKPGDIESEYKPTRVYVDFTLGKTIGEAKRTGHNNIPVVKYKADFVGIFRYRPSRHDNMDRNIPITKVMEKYRNDGGKTINVCTSNMSDEQIKEYLQDNDLRFVPVIDKDGKLDRLVFLQKRDDYKIGGAIDTHPGWEKRAEALAEAGAHIIFIDTSDAHKPFSREVVEEQTKLIKKYKDMGKDFPPICAGNIVTGDAFLYLAESGADIVKTGMGSGSICTTNDVLRVGRAPFAALIDVTIARDEYYKKTGKYIPAIADGGIADTGDVNISLAADADAIMGGRIFGCFYESEGDRLGKDGKIYPKDKIDEDFIKGVKIYGEASEEAMGATGDMKRYSAPSSKEGITTFQGISGIVKYRGRFKPGLESYVKALKEALYHVGAKDLISYRKKAILERLSEEAKRTASPHGIEIIG